MRPDRLRCAIVLIDDDDRSVQLLARLSRHDGYAVALTVGAAAAARRRDVRMLARLLRADGWLVDISIGDWAGVERLTRHPHPDVLLIDVDAQGAAACALIRHAHALAPSLAIVLVSDRPNELGAAITASAGALVLEKPLDYGAIRHALLSDVRPRTTSEIVPLGESADSRQKLGDNRG